jgi:uncharacterized protein
MAFAATLFIIVAGLIVSWFVAGALIAPAPSRIGNTPTDLRVASIAIESESGSTICGWHTRAEPSRGVMVLLHGIRGSRLTMLDRARWLDSLGYSTVLVDLQAHGESSGKYITLGHLEKEDARAAVKFARREHPGEPIGVIGVSLGGAAALLASPLDVDAIVLESVYTNISDAVHNRVAAKLGPLASIPSTLLLIQLEPRLGVSPSQLRPIDHILNAACPVYIVSGTADEHTTVDDTRALFSAAQSPKDLWLVEDAAHVDLMSFSTIQYQKQIAEFL